MRPSTLPVVILAVLLLTRCTSFVDSTGDTGVRRVGPEGGEVRAPGVALQLPASALDQVQDISLSVTDAPDPTQMLRQVVVSPPGLWLNLPATLTVSFEPALVGPGSPALARLDGDRWVMMTGQSLAEGGRTVSAPLSLLGTFALLPPSSALASTTPDGGQAARVAYCNDVKAVLDRYCVSCHGAQTTNVAPDLSTYATAQAAAARSAYRANALDQVPPQGMPPQGAPMPSDLERQVLSDWVTQGTPEGVCADGGTP